MKKNYHIEDIQNALQNRVPYVQEATGIYAVLLLLLEVEGETCLLYQVRSDELDIQPGEICFPGGRLEPGESLQEAALRETWEELGILPEEVEVITQLDLLQDVSDRAIYPFLGKANASVIERMTLNQQEVKEVFMVPLSFLQENPPFVYETPVIMQIGDDFPYDKIGIPPKYTWRAGSTNVPIYEYEEYRIWGLTARMTRWLINVLEQEGVL